MKNNIFSPNSSYAQAIFKINSKTAIAFTTGEMVFFTRQEGSECE